MISLARTGARWRAVNWPALIFGAAIVSLWEALVRALALSQSLFPPPSYVMWSLYVRFDLLMEHAWPTFYQTLIGFLLSVVLGVALGWIISKSRTLFEALYPVVVVLQVVPKEALAPLLVLWFGAGTLSCTVLAFLIAFFPMVINTIFGVRSLNTAMRDYATSLLCNRWQFFTKVELPWALTSIFAGMKISVTLSVIGIVVAEIVAGRNGLGYLLLFAASRLDMGFSLAILLVLAIWGGALFAAVVLLEQRAVYWRR